VALVGTLTARRIRQPTGAAVQQERAHCAGDQRFNYSVQRRQARLSSDESTTARVLHAHRGAFHPQDVMGRFDYQIENREENNCFPFEAPLQKPGNQRSYGTVVVRAVRYHQINADNNYF
jgi:hypothetical protein